MTNAPMLTLRDMTTDDLDLVVHWRCNPLVNKYLSDRLKSRQDVDSWFARVRSNPKVWLKTIHYKDRTVGYAAVESIDELSRKCELAMVIGDADCWGKGIGTEVSRLMLHYAFDDLHLHRVMGVVVRGNERSERMLKRLGLQYEGCMRDGICIAGQFHDLLWYGILDEEYAIR